MKLKLNDELSTEGISCYCCDDPKIEHRQRQQKDSENDEELETKKLLNDITLIVIGLVLTATIVVLELILPS